MLLIHIWYVQFRQITCLNTARSFPVFLLKLPFAGIVMLLALSSCNVSKHIDTEKGERLLMQNSLKIKSEKRLGITAKSSITTELTPFYRQKPNRRNLGIFYTRLWFHYKYKDRTTDFAKWINKRIAETPTLYDSVLTQRTASNFKNQMRKRGYFQAECDYSTKLVGKYRVKTSYNLDLGPRYTVDHVQFSSRDTQILMILNYIYNHNDLLLLHLSMFCLHNNWKYM